jgi:hypothetical protein
MGWGAASVGWCKLCQIVQQQLTCAHLQATPMFEGPSKWQGVVSASSCVAATHIIRSVKDAYQHSCEMQPRLSVTAVHVCMYNRLPSAETTYPVQARSLRLISPTFAAAHLLLMLAWLRPHSTSHNRASVYALNSALLLISPAMIAQCSNLLSKLLLFHVDSCALCHASAMSLQCQYWILAGRRCLIDEQLDACTN